MNEFPIILTKEVYPHYKRSARNHVFYNNDHKQSFLASKFDYSDRGLYWLIAPKGEVERFEKLVEEQIDEEAERRVQQILSGQVCEKCRI